MDKQKLSAVKCEAQLAAQLCKYAFFEDDL